MDKINNKNNHLNRGINCPCCGKHLIDLEHDGYDGDDENYHEYYCEDCDIEITISTKTFSIDNN